MAGLGRKTFTAGEVLTAANVQGYLMDQAVQVYASAAARSSALGTAVSTGMVSYRTDGTAIEFYNGSAWAGLGDVTLAGTQTLTNKTLTTPTINTPTIATANFTSAAQELVTVVGTGFAGYTFDAVTQAVVYITANSTANGTLNIRGNSGTTLNSYMATGESMTIVLAITNNATAYYPTTYQIDGSAVTVKWAGGTAPTGGNANSIDVYTLTVIKTGSAAYTVLGSQTKFA